MGEERNKANQENKLLKKYFISEDKKKLTAE